MAVASPQVFATTKRILIFRALQVGDLLCSVPALRAIRQAAPEAHIAFLSLPWARDFVARYHEYLDEFIEFPGFPGLPERTPDLAAFPDFVRDMQARQFGLTIQMHGSGGLVNSLLELFAAERSAGYCESATPVVDERSAYLPYPNNVHEVHRHLALARFLGAATDDDALEFPIQPDDLAELAQHPEARLLRAGQYICLHPGARYLTRRWPAERYAAVGDYFAARGYSIVLTGSASERELVDAVAHAMRFPSVHFGGKTSLGAAGALVARASLVITNDTGMSHLAAAVGAPSIVVVQSSDAARWAPLDSALHPTVLSNIACRPCEHRVCPIGFPCSELITPEAVMRRARRTSQCLAQRSIA